MEKLRVDYLIEDDYEVLEKMKQAYLNCPTAIKYLNDLKIPEQTVYENIAKVYDFVNDLNYCKNCPGIKNCAKNHPMLCTKIVYTHGQVERELVPCKEFIKRVAFERTFAVRDFEDEWLDLKLLEIDRNKGRTFAVKVYNNYLKNGVNDWLYLKGSKNSGRSYFAAALVVDAAKHNRGPIAYLNTSLRIKDLYDISSKAKERFQKDLDFYSNVPILVLDDFGNEYKNDFVRDAIVFQILSNRASKRLFTIFTSDFSLEEIGILYSTSKAGEIRSRQIVNLIKSMAKEEISLGEISIY
jgi:DNA replication protein DnaC